MSPRQARHPSGRARSIAAEGDRKAVLTEKEEDSNSQQNSQKLCTIHTTKAEPSTNAISLTLLVDDPAGQAGGHCVAEVLRGQRGGHPVEGHVDELLGQMLPEQREQEAEVLVLLLLDRYTHARKGEAPAKQQQRNREAGVKES